MKENTLVLYIVISKQNKLLLFADEPERSDDIVCGWKGNLYINSIIYNQLSKMIKQSDMNYNSEPEQIAFTIKD